MEILKPILNKPALRKIGLNKPSLLSAGNPHGGKVKPYIAGHVTDGASTFTFKVNKTTEITVPVGNDGNWKWNVDRVITSLESAFQDITNIDYVEINGKAFNETQTIYYLFRQSSVINVVIKNTTLDKVANMYGCFYNTRSLKTVFFESSTFSAVTDNYVFGAFGGSSVKTISMPNATFDSLESFNLMLYGCASLEDFEIKEIPLDFSTQYSSKLTEQSVVNIFNAVAADGITLTFYSTVYAMIQAQLEIEDSPIYNAYWDSDYDFTIASA